MNDDVIVVMALIAEKRVRTSGMRNCLLDMQTAAEFMALTMRTSQGYSRGSSGSGLSVFMPAIMITGSLW